LLNPGSIIIQEFPQKCLPPGRPFRKNPQKDRVSCEGNSVAKVDRSWVIGYR